MFKLNQIELGINVRRPEVMILIPFFFFIVLKFK